MFNTAQTKTNFLMIFPLKIKGVDSKVALILLQSSNSGYTFPISGDL
jgi:hypothetical protein